MLRCKLKLLKEYSLIRIDFEQLFDFEAAFEAAIEWFAVVK